MMKSLYLPQELTIQILLRLPVKSLVRLKCVCKSWLSLISDPHFARSHFELAPTAHTHRLMFITNTSPVESRSIDLDASLNDDSTFISLKLEAVLSPQSYLLPTIVGSCRGFLFLKCRSGGGSYIWNPSTGSHTQIPPSPVAPKINPNLGTCLFGFGYDPSTDDYLVVQVCYSLPSGNRDHFIHLEFFSLRANTWKDNDVSHLPYVLCYVSIIGLLLNGAIHWLVFNRDTHASVILAFDLMKRNLSEIPLPPDDFDYHPACNGLQLFTFRGFLSLWVTSNCSVDMWVMEEYKVQSSWTKTLVLSHNQYSTPICSTKRGDIVASDDSMGLVKYNDKGQLLEYRTDLHIKHVSSVAMYTESLLALPGDKEQTEDGSV